MKRLYAQWALILVSSAALGALLAWLHVPAALLLGPMLAGITIASFGSSARVPNALFLIAQGIFLSTMTSLQLIFVQSRMRQNVQPVSGSRCCRSANCMSVRTLINPGI